MMNIYTQADTQNFSPVRYPHMVTVTLLAAAALIVLTGCADTPHADAAYGNAFRQTVQAQTYDLNAANNPAPEAPTTADAERLKNALEVYRSDVAKGSEEVKQKVVFEVGSY